MCSGWKQVQQSELFGETCHFCGGGLDYCNWTYDGKFLCWEHKKALVRVWSGVRCDFCSEVFLHGLKKIGDAFACTTCLEKVEILLNENFTD